MDGAVGMGTTTPLDRLHIRYNNNTGDFTGLAVQNMNGGAFAYSGMLFYDHTGALTQFQGYNNSHPRIPHQQHRGVAGGAFNGSINFMLGGTSRFFVGSNGNVGIGTASPVDEPRGQQRTVGLWHVERLVDHLRQHHVRIGDRRTEGARHNRRADRRAGQ